MAARFSDILVDASVVLRDGERRTLPLDELGYTYRHCELPEGAVVVEATFRGTPGDPEAIGAEMDRIAARARNRSRCAAEPAARPSRTRRATRPGSWSMRRAAAA